jgi:hypothetical protein
MFKSIRGKILFGIVFCSTVIVTGIIFNRNIFEQFLPRSLVFQDATLEFFYAATCVVFFAAFLITGVFNLKIYYIYKSRLVPFKGYYWNYGMRSIAMSFVFLMELSSLFVAYYWLEICVRITASLFSIALVFSLISSHKEFEEMSTPDEYQKLSDKIIELQKDKEDLINILNKINE